jgi:hypothetical protein
MEVFDDTFIPPGLETWFATRGCPGCHAGHLDRVEGLDEVHWRCPECGDCWRVEHGRLRLTDPLTCHGCTARTKSECIAVLQRDFPRFAAGVGTDQHP